MDTKKCSKCGEVKGVEEFNKRKDSNDGYRTYCIICERTQRAEYRSKNKAKKKETDRAYRINNADKINIRQAEWRKENKEKLKEYFKEHYARNKERIKKRINKYRVDNIEKVKAQQSKTYKKYAKERCEYMTKWGRSNPEKRKKYVNKYIDKNRAEINKKGVKYYHDNKLHMLISKGVLRSLKGNKPKRTFEMLEYSEMELRIHIESQFTEGMSWENMGMKGWHIDHIVPFYAFDFNTHSDVQFNQCWSLKNLRPMWASANISKSNNIGSEWGNQELYEEFFPERKIV